MAEINPKGIIYISKIPRFMHHNKLRHYMSQFGDVCNIRLSKEDKSVYNNRVKKGGTKKANYTEGWVEFEKRKVAKRVALSLNGTPVGGKKRHNFWREDVWCIKYLPGFEWHHLTEEVTFTKMERAEKIRYAMTTLAVENAKYLEKVEKQNVKGKVEKAIACEESEDRGV
eukprot:GHVO01054578.1.p1 GENE.GHVO01054578.1~~GHVO01054578.1.p1  ORF type:complete len:170 (+),score=33.89 GHVO01054578.1:1-510(+)